MNKFWGLAQQERLLFVQTALLIPLVSLGLHVLGWQRLMRFLEGPGNSKNQRPPAEQTHDYACRIAYVVNAAGHRLHATCLPRSIVLWWLLRHEGIETRLMLGARKEQGGFWAHAWIEYEGEVINDRAETRDVFAVFEKTEATHPPTHLWRL